MGKEFAARERQFDDLVVLARRWLARYADQGARLRHPARAIRAAIPTGESLDAVHPLPATPERFTVAAADGSQIQPNPHGVALYYLINVGSLVYRHGSGKAPEPHSEPSLGYAEADLYENGHLVNGNLLDVRRDLAEIACLADLCAVEPPGPTVALVDGTLVLWVLEERSSQEWRRSKVTDYLDQLTRIRQAGAVVAAFVSRPRRAEVTKLLYLASLEGNVERAEQEPNPLAIPWSACLTAPSLGPCLRVRVRPFSSAPRPSTMTITTPLVTLSTFSISTWQGRDVTRSSHG
jgi:hypothetical protein